jgi:hypothetical protein
MIFVTKMQHLILGLSVIEVHGLKRLENVDFYDIFVKPLVCYFSTISSLQVRKEKEDLG